MSTERRLIVLTDGQWADVPMKSIAGAVPNAVWFDHNWIAGLAKLYVTPVPTGSSYSLVLYSAQELAQFADATTTYTFHAGYVRALRLNLAMALAPEFGGLRDPITATQAAEAMKWLKIVNLRPVDLTFGPGVPGRRVGQYVEWTLGQNL